MVSQTGGRKFGQSGTIEGGKKQKQKRIFDQGGNAPLPSDHEDDDGCLSKFTGKRTMGAEETIRILFSSPPIAHQLTHVFSVNA